MEFQHIKHHKKTFYPKLYVECLLLIDYSDSDNITKWCVSHLTCVVMLITWDNTPTLVDHARNDTKVGIV